MVEGKEGEFNQEIQGKIGDNHERIENAERKLKKHILRKHPTGIIPTTCHRCIDFNTTIQAAQERIRSLQGRLRDN